MNLKGMSDLELFELAMKLLIKVDKLLYRIENYFLKNT